MENLEKHYMLLLTAEEQKFLKLYLQNPAMTNKTLLRLKPFRLLEEKPYPVLDILLLQPPHVMVHIKWAIIRTFEELLRVVAKNGINTGFLQFLIKIPDDILNEALQGELREKFQQCLSHSQLKEEFYLSLLSRKDKQLLADILEYLKDTKWQCFQQPVGSKEFVLYHALKSKTHFMSHLIQELREFHNIEDVALRNNLIIVKLVHEFSEKASKSLNQLPSNMEALLELIDLENVEEDLVPVYEHFYKDFKRLLVVLQYIGKFPNALALIGVEELLSINSILDIISQHRLLKSYEETKEFLETYYNYQQYLPMFSLKEKEIELLGCYYILATTYDIITSGAFAEIVPDEAFYSQKIQKLNSLLRQIKNFELLCQMLEDVILFIYLRWEHFNGDSKGVKYRKLDYSDSSSRTDDDILQDSSNTPQKHGSKSLCKNGKFGFVCKSKSFITLFNFLKSYVTKKFHSPDYKQASSEMKSRFQKIADTIGDFLWKHAFFEKMENSQNRNFPNSSSIHYDSDTLMHMVHFHVDSIERISSDDEGGSNQYSLARRKAVKKRRRATFSGASAITGEKGTDLQQTRTRATILSSSMKFHAKPQNVDFPSEKSEEKSVVPKLLSSPERLACLALSFKQFNEAKEIIKNFNLHNSQLNLELDYMEHQQRVKQKLSDIYANYQQQEKQSLDSTEPITTVEMIRNVAAKGFEVSKIINIIDHFAQMQSIKQTESVKELIRKHKQNPQYRFLSQFEECNLKAVIICDLILSLPFNRDITHSILMIIKRNQAIQSNFKEAESGVGEKSQFPSNMGPLNFLENLSDCMRLLADKSITDILCDNCYSLKPKKLAVELAKEKVFYEVFHKKPKELSRCEDLKALVPQFQMLKSKHNYYQQFCNYMQHLSMLVRLITPKGKQLHVDDLLRIDPCDVIGELIFSRNMTPLEIEANVTALNLNLVHVIALNICPEIVGGRSLLTKRSIPSNKESTILNYIANHNRLLVFLLQGINNGNHFSQDSNTNHINAGFLERLVQMPEVAKLSFLLYSDNKVISALRSDHINVKSLDKLTSKTDQLHLLELEMGIQESKPLKQKRMDRLITELIEEDPKNIYLASKIHDITLRAKLIHANFSKISTIRLAKQLIETTLQHRHAAKRIPKELLQQLEIILADIRVYAKVSEVLHFETWPQAYDFGLKTPATIFEGLLQLRLYKLCYEWCKVVKLSENFKPEQFLNILLKSLMDLTDVEESPSDPEQIHPSTYLLKILETFQPNDCRAFLLANKDTFRCMILLKFAIEYLERSASAEEKLNYRNYKISLVIFEQLSPAIRHLFWNLLKYPLLIVEQLIMNVKFEVLTKVLAVIRQELQSGNRKLCSFCFDKNGYAYDIHGHHHPPHSPHKVRFQLGSQEASNASAFILLNFNLYQKDHFISNDCIDLLLRIYATKSLDYQISDTNSSSEPYSQSTCDMQQSLDSLCGAFQMPSRAPTREEWVRDEEATHCMCCRRTAFSMLMRRHHCRRCGRVVCFSCSTYRMRIPELYEDVEVRICNDCHNLCEDINQRKANRDSQAEDESNAVRIRLKPEERFKWKLSGNITHDKLLREEFCYEHAPSVALCLSILEYHMAKQKCVDLLLFHCRKLEKLLVPNPEVDYELVAKMMNCLALAAKVRGASAEFETIREHSEIIISVVQNGCESLIPPDPLNNHGLWKLAESLVEAERWDLALEVHLKCGLSTTGVIAAHGMSCLKAGCFETAREKFSHCMTRLTNENMNGIISKVIFNPALNASHDNVESMLGLSKDQDIHVVKRPHNGPRLLQEILKIIESMPFNKPQPETLQRASIIRSSNSSLVALLSRRKEAYVKRTHEPAINILNTLSNLKRISKGQYTSVSNQAGTQLSNNNGAPLIDRNQLFRKTSGFEECLYYLLTYGSHIDVIHFLMNHNELVATLKYFLLQKLDADIFINHIYMVMLSRGKAAVLIKQMLEFDGRLLIWRSTLLQTCRYLETQNFLNSLYELQILLKDPIRACMTCIKFYSMNCEDFKQQHLNAQHLRNARMHLQSELDNFEWEKINLNSGTVTKSNKNSSRRSSTSSATGSTGGGNFLLQMDARSLNSHITTIANQLDVAKFLAHCEEENSKDGLITEKILKQLRIDSVKSLPTLFDSTPEKIQICILILLCGKNIYEGLGLCYRIIQHYKIPAIKVYAATAKYLALNQRLSEIEKLLNCANNVIGTQDIDEILTVAIISAVNIHDPETKAILDNLTKKIHNIEMRISSHIFIGQLKSAYLLANKYERLSDIRKILRQAEATNQVHIKKLCEKKLQMTQSSASNQSK
ncbi:zinc finger FYVE domain-containing protein 26 homolog [Stomoxys calcitrans]|uniref:zinc finger FYVE domain-containing protein 26 homolog n=1 Tax=Stomoxys calcitrans TaxID=35570 RepID=UPI0027E39394|nr:zinc finger FYVE domain-containing protein 26 homolog [Stomoxys calcitrans]